MDFPDTLSVILRGASFIALFQAAGTAIFLALFGHSLQSSSGALRRITRVAAIAGVVTVAGQLLLQAARMADDMSGIVDPALQAMTLGSADGATAAMRILGLTVIAIAIGRRDQAAMALCLAGALAVTASFVLSGHTASSPLRWLKAPLLFTHVTVVAFWFGALLPLHIASTRETARTAAQVTQAFSIIAGWWVPLILAAGLCLALILLRHAADLGRAYGFLLIGKLIGFCALMALAATNKYRLVPAIADGDENAARSFRVMLKVEYALISIVLSITVVMTTFFSPEH